MDNRLQNSKVYRRVKQADIPQPERLNIPSKYEVDLQRVTRAFKKVGAPEMLTRALTDEELADAEKKGLTVLQWRLLWLFKHLFYEELQLCKEEYENTGMGCPVQVSGLRFREKMEKYPVIAEQIFGEWAVRIGVNHLYAETLGACGDQHDILFHIYQNSSGHTVYERFITLLRTLK